MRSGRGGRRPGEEIDESGAIAMQRMHELVAHDPTKGNAELRRRVANVKEDDGTAVPGDTVDQHVTKK